MPETLTEPTRHRIGSWEFPKDAASIRAVVFGHMVRLATPIVRHYVSDLYHDATWLTEHVTGDDARFLFAAREMGTTIGMEPEYVMQFRDGTAKAWEVHFERDRHWLDVVFTPIY